VYLCTQINVEKDRFECLVAEVPRRGKKYAEPVTKNLNLLFYSSVITEDRRDVHDWPKDAAFRFRNRSKSALSNAPNPKPFLPSNDQLCRWWMCKTLQRLSILSWNDSGLNGKNVVLWVSGKRGIRRLVVNLCVVHSPTAIPAILTRVIAFLCTDLYRLHQTWNQLLPEIG